MPMIVITGANGALGRAVVDRVLDRVAPEQVAVCVRDATAAQPLADRGVRVRQGDFAEPASLAPAFDGASRVLVVSVNATGADAVALHRNAFTAARDAGASRVVYTSHMGANPASPFAPMPDHAATEKALRETGVPYTALRNGFYAASAVMLLQAALATGELAVPEDGPIAWTSHADLAEAAATALTDDALDGVTAPLTAAEALDMTDVAAAASAVTGKAIRRVVVSPEEYRERLVTHGVPAAAAGMLVGLFAAARLGDFSRTDTALAELLGRAPQTLRDVLAARLG